MVAWGDVPTWLAVVGGSVGGYAALRQLSMQREQLKDQQELIAQQNRLLERQQAGAVAVEFSATLGGPAGVIAEDSTAMVYQAVVINNSGRPIRDVAARITPQGMVSAGAAAAALLANWEISSKASDRILSGRRNADRWPALAPGARCALIFAFEVDMYRNVAIAVRFDDDDGREWQVDQDLHLAKLDSRAGDW